jgi:hypothetical protein
MFFRRGGLGRRFMDHGKIPVNREIIVGEKSPLIER